MPDEVERPGTRSRGEPLSDRLLACILHQPNNACMVTR